MKHSLFFLPLWFITAPLLLIIHSAVIIFLPYPFSHINIFAAAIILSLLITESGAIVWYAFGLFYILDWYTVGPFGIVISAGVLATLVLVWLYRGVLSNRGVRSAAILAAVFVALFRIFYSLGLIITKGYGEFGNFSPLFLRAGVELLATTSFVSIIYFILAQFLPSLKVTHTKRTTLYAGN